MALTKTQQPNNIHSVFLPEYYTWKTDTSLITNFYFTYTLTDLDSEFFVGNTVTLENYLSYNDPTEILKSKTKFSFNPEITTIENIEQNVCVYLENVYEVETTAVTFTNSAVSFRVKTACRYSDPDFNPYDHLLNSGTTSTRDFLVNMGDEHDIRFEDDFTFRTYNGKLDSESTGATYEGRVKYYILDLFMDSDDSNFQSAQLRSEANPYYESAQSECLTATTSGSNYMIEIPAGINNWNNKAFTLVNFTTGGTSYTDNVTTDLTLDSTFFIPEFPTNFTPAILSGTVSYYEIWAVDEDKKINTRISKKHKFTPVVDCRWESLNVCWENTKGGIDYYLFQKASEKSISTKKIKYDQNMYSLDLSDEEVQKFNYDKRTVVYRNEVTSIIEVHSDWLSQDDIDGLEDMFKSTNVFMNYKNSWKYVISVATKAIIFNKRRKGLKKYKLKFQLSEKNVRY